MNPQFIITVIYIMLLHGVKTLEYSNTVICLHRVLPIVRNVADQSLWLHRKREKNK